MYKPLRQDLEADKSIHPIDEEDDEDDRIQSKCFNFKTEIKMTIKYIIKECPRIFDL
jgi:hypothetical protein